METSDIRVGSPSPLPSLSMPALKQTWNKIQIIVDRILKNLDILYYDDKIKFILVATAIGGLFLASVSPLAGTILSILSIGLHILLGRRYLAVRQNEIETLVAKREEVIALKAKVDVFIDDIKICRAPKELISKSALIYQELILTKDSLPESNARDFSHYQGYIDLIDNFERQYKLLYKGYEQLLNRDSGLLPLTPEVKAVLEANMEKDLAKEMPTHRKALLDVLGHISGCLEILMKECDIN